MSRKAKVLLGVGIYIAVIVAVFLIFGNDGENDSFQPQNEFKLEPWIHLKVFGIDMSITKAVLYLALASVATVATMLWISNRMQQKPNRVQTVMELAYDLTKNNITGSSLEGKYALRWFPFVATLFFWIWFSKCSATCRCRPTPSTPSTCSGWRSRRSRSTRRPRTSRFPWS